MNVEQKKPEITEERIRQIVREEIAAFMGRQRKIALTLDEIKIAEILERAIN